MFRYGLILLIVTTCCSCLPAAEDTLRQKRILDGSSYDSEDYPFHISIWYSGKKPDDFKDAITDHFCSGTLVNTHWVMTSAFCINGNLDVKKWTAYPNLHDQNEPGKENKIVEIVVHPEYHSQGMYHKNIALLKLATSVDASKTGFANFDSECPTSEENLHVIGWGKTNDVIVSRVPNILPSLSLYDTQNCNNFYNRKKVYEAFGVSGLKADEFTVCAVSNSGGNFLGNGDAGAPLIANCNDKNVVVGLAAYMYNDCQSNKCPTLFTRVSAFSDWIKEVTSQ